MEESSAPHKHAFYETPWGVLLLAFGALTLLILFYLVFQVILQFKKVGIEELAHQYRARFTQGGRISPVKPREAMALTVADDPSFGPKSAPLEIIEFADYECPFSRDFSFGLRELMVKYPQRFQFIIRDFPLNEIHPRAFRAAEAANCAGDQEKYWQMHDKIFQNQDRLSDLDLKLYAVQVGLDMSRFNVCFDGRIHREEIEIDAADGQAAGVVGTPTFFINGVKVEGAIPKEVLEKIILSAK